MSPGMRTKADKRLTWFAAAVLLWGTLIFVQLLNLQVVHHSTYQRMARKQQERVQTLPAPRGSIFDRTGQVLAMSVPMDSVYIDPLQAPDLQVAADILSGVLNVDRAALYERMQWYAHHNKGYMWIAHKIDRSQAERLRSLHLDWIQFATEYRRDYPKLTLAAHVVGALNGEDKGQWGVEKSLEGELRGAPGAMRVLRDAKGRGIDSQVETEPRPGTGVTLTIDERIQFPAERAIERAVRDAHAESGSVVVMDPRSGDILAMASYPGFDPSRQPTPGEKASVRFNHAVSVPFEPGSVFKVITLSSALETTSLRPESLINCGGGSITLFGRTIHEAHGGYGILPMAMVLAKSSNIGAIQIGMRVGQNNLYNYVRRFGFGERTGVPLPAESPGIVRRLTRWGKTSLSSVSMGHEVGVTTLQLAQACSVVANGGMLVRPRLILRVGDQATPTVSPRRVIQPQTAITMRQMMEGVVLVGTGRKYANLQGYSAAGKTGSAQIYDFATRHYTHSYNASFMGFSPVANPSIVVVVTVNSTHGGTAGYGGPVSGPIFRAVATETLRVLDVPKDLPDVPLDSTPAAQVADLNDAAIPNPDPAEPNVLEEAASTPPAAPSPSTGPAGRWSQGSQLRGFVHARCSGRGAGARSARFAYRRGHCSHASTAGRRHPAPRRKNSSRIRQMTLGEILAGVRLKTPLSPHLSQLRVEGLDYDSRRVQPGFLFFAFPGARADGRQFARDAVGRGAIAVASESAGASEMAAPWIEVEHGRQALALAAHNFYGHPDQHVALTGITGTNGKTTTSFLIDSILRAAGKTTALIGTIEYHLAGQVLPAVNTTPESLDLDRLFTSLREQGGTHATLEVSSHALALGRVYGLHFHTAIFTNLTRDHLDFHQTMEDYFAAKQLLFSGAGAPPPSWAVLNRDDEWCRRLELSPDTQALWYGLGQGATVRARHIASNLQGLRFEVHASQRPLHGGIAAAGQDQRV